MKRLLLILILALPVLAQTSQVTAPAAGSILAASSSVTVQWSADSSANLSFPYYLMASAVGYYDYELGYITTTGTAATINTPASGNLYLTLYSAVCINGGAGGCSYSAVLQSNAVGAADYTVASPANGSTLSYGNPGNYEVFTISANVAHVILQAGYNGPGASDYFAPQDLSTWGLPGTSGWTFNNLAFSNVHPILYVTLTYNGVAKYFQYNTPAPSGGTISLVVGTTSGDPTGGDDYSPDTSPTVLSTVGIFPSSGNGQSATFEITYYNPGGASNIYFTEMEIGPSQTTAAACAILYYDANYNEFTLNADNGAWQGTYAVVGSNTTLSNSQCSIDAAGVSVQNSGNTATLTLPITFTSSFAGAMNVYSFVENLQGQTQNWTQMGTWTTTGTSGYAYVQTAAKETIRIKRGDKLSIGDLQYSNAPDLNGTKYTYTFDNRQVARFAIGMPEGPSIRGTVSKPDGWIGGALHNAAWGQFKNAALSENGTFTVTSKLLPGLLPAYFQSDWDGMIDSLNGRTPPADVGATHAKTLKSSEDQTMLASASGIFGNSLQKWVIGPVFQPGASMVDILARVKVWANEYGFPFLQPLLDAKDPLATLDTLQPVAQIEQDVVACLRNVMQGAAQ